MASARIEGAGALAIVRVPKPEDEARRQLDREIKNLQKERGVHTKRIQSLLFARGIAMMAFAAPTLGPDYFYE
jgi:transposase